LASLPEEIDDWTVGTITDLLNEGYYETENMEFKENIGSDNDRIARTVCSFTNTKGGIMIFGILDDREKNAFERLVGLEKSQDNITKISNQIKNIVPEIPMESIFFTKKPIELPNGREIVLLKITASNFLHQFDDKFYKRLPGRNQPMPYDEIKTKFIEKRKNRRALSSFFRELSITKRILLELNKGKDNDFPALLSEIDNISDDKLFNFINTQGYLYDEDTFFALEELLEIINKLRMIEGSYQHFSEMEEKFRIECLKSVAANTTEQYAANIANYFSKIGMEHISKLEKSLGKIPELISNKYDVFGTRTKEIVKEIQDKKPSSSV